MVPVIIIPKDLSKMSSFEANTYLEYPSLPPGKSGIHHDDPDFEQDIEQVFPPKFEPDEYY